MFKDVRAADIIQVQTLTTKDCKGPQTNMPENVGSIKTWSAKMKWNMSIIHVVDLFCEYSMYYFLNEWEGRTKKYLAPGQDVRTEAGAQRGLVSHAGVFRVARISSLPTNAFVGRDETRAPLKTPAWEAKRGPVSWSRANYFRVSPI